LKLTFFLFYLKRGQVRDVEENGTITGNVERVFSAPVNDVLAAA